MQGMINEVLDIVNKQETNPTQKYRLSLKIASFLFKVDKSISFEEKQTRFDSFVSSLPLFLVIFFFFLTKQTNQSVADPGAVARVDR